MTTVAGDPSMLRERARSLRATAAALERVAVRAALADAGPATWTGPTASRILDDLRRVAAGIDRAVGVLRRLATRLEHDAGPRT